jgi:hypothetical protein
MAIEIKKLQDLEYNELVTLSVIEGNDTLRKMFTDDVKVSFNVLRSLSQEGGMNENTKEIIRDIFDKIICTQKSHINNYLSVASTPSVAPPVIHSVTPSPTKEKKLPRRYGKDNIMADIEKQGGKPTNAQLTALELNDLKNIYINLNSRMVNDLLSDRKILNDEDYRTIRSAIEIVKNRMKPIFKKK